ncbi:AbrB/MazE/SpoVT family DNA-binding domain-containing protein [Streptomyces chrestomyceticus]|uniref:AbrB/MazE/SpoVT family DNA-binding domain-containing protein n=1 Tax=Streptomyces chrestomyceticus TaxID=68185 RepID=UPI0035A8DDFF
MGETPPGDDQEVVSRAHLRKKRQLTLPKDVQDALHLTEGDVVEFSVHADGEVTLRSMSEIPRDQQWFWTEEWQAGEREASEQVDAGEGTFHGDVDSMFAELNS